MGKTGRPHWGTVAAGVGAFLLGIAMVVGGVVVTASDHLEAGTWIVVLGMPVIVGGGLLMIRGATSRRR